MLLLQRLVLPTHPDEVHVQDGDPLDTVLVSLVRLGVVIEHLFHDLSLALHLPDPHLQFLILTLQLFLLVPPLLLGLQVSLEQQVLLGQHALESELQVTHVVLETLVLLLLQLQ